MCSVLTPWPPAHGKCPVNLLMKSEMQTRGGACIILHALGFAGVSLQTWGPPSVVRSLPHPTARRQRGGEQGALTECLEHACRSESHFNCVSHSTAFVL